MTLVRHKRRRLAVHLLLTLVMACVTATVAVLLDAGWAILVAFACGYCLASFDPLAPRIRAPRFPPEADDPGGSGPAGF